MNVSGNISIEKVCLGYTLGVAMACLGCASSMPEVYLWYALGVFRVCFALGNAYLGVTWDLGVLTWGWGSSLGYS